MNLRELILSPLALLYRIGGVIDRQRSLKRRASFPVPVISVGGITAGGSGKTPFVRELISLMQDEYEIILLTRGYGRSSRMPVIWKAGERIPSPEVIGDEPALLARSIRNGILGVGSNRTDVLQEILQGKQLPQSLVLLDDGFQHYPMHRDLDIVLVDDRAAQERFLLPAGYLREPRSALRRADILIASSDEAAEMAERYSGESSSIFRVSYHTPHIIHWESGKKLNESGQPILLVTGIARPERVLAASGTHNIEIVGHARYRDHHAYTRKDVRKLMQQVESMGAEYILTTEKDAVKLQRFQELQELLYVLPLSVRIEDQQRLQSILRNTINRTYRNTA